MMMRRMMMVMMNRIMTRMTMTAVIAMTAVGSLIQRR